MNRSILYGVYGMFFIMLVMSCRTVKDGQYFQDIHPDEIELGYIEDSLLNLEVAYIGAIGHSFIFECTIENNSSENLLIDKRLFSMELNDQIVTPNDEDQIINDLKRDRTQLKKRKKDATIISGIIVGLGVIAGASEGLNPGELLLYNADPIIAIFDERRWYQRNIESVEDEVMYIQEAQFKDQVIPPGQSLTRDVLFPTTKVKSEVTIVFTYSGEQYSVTFPKKIFR